jgi:hypothetical protein
MKLTQWLLKEEVMSNFIYILILFIGQALVIEPCVNYSDEMDGVESRA